MVRAYVDPDQKNPKFASRFDLSVRADQQHPAKWEFSLPNSSYPFGDNVTGEFAPAPYNNKPRTTIKATLHRFDTYDEQITFKNLPLNALVPLPAGAYASPMRHLELTSAQTQTTPSGISVTLPVQSADALPLMMNGNADAVFINIRVSPNAILNRLPNSPLVQKYGKDVRIKLEVPDPDLLVWYGADNTFPRIAVGIPHLRTATTMDLTLILRQKVELETVPVAFDVPVARQKINAK